MWDIDIYAWLSYDYPNLTEAIMEEIKQLNDFSKIFV